MGLRERIGVDLGQRCKIEDGLAAAVQHGIRYLDVKIDVAPNAIETLTPERIKGIRDLCEGEGIHIGVHTMSAVNVAEVAPHVRDGVESYLKGHMDACKKLGGEWMVVHAGYHFTSDVKMRMEAGLERLKRLSGYAEKLDITLLLENMNWSRTMPRFTTSRTTSRRRSTISTGSIRPSCVGPSRPITRTSSRTASTRF
jgi:hydroxypyruvate isomerase